MFQRNDGWDITLSKLRESRPLPDEQTPERRIVTTGKGSDWFGKCDQCGKHCSEHYKCQTKHGSGWTNGAYGHKECLEKNFPEFVSPNVKLRGRAL